MYGDLTCSVRTVNNFHCCVIIKRLCIWGPYVRLAMVPDMLSSWNKIIINRFGGGINKAWKETDETEKNSPPIKTCLKDNIAPFPGIKICWGPRQWAFYSNITSSQIFIQSLCSTCSTTLAWSSNLYHLSLKPYSYKQSCNSVCISKLASTSVNHIMKRCIAEFHALRHKTPLNTCTPL